MMVDFYDEEIKAGFIRGIKTYMNTLASTVLKDAEQFILDAISLKKGNKEVAIFYNPDRNEPWGIEVGNKSQYFNIGETGGEFRVYSGTLFDAIMALKKNING